MMQTHKLSNGRVKVVLDSGHSFYAQKCNDPIDGLIDIGLMQQRTAAIIENPTLFEDGLIPETFFYALGLAYNSKACYNIQNKERYEHHISGFNLEIKKQQLLRERKDLVDAGMSINETISIHDFEWGKYDISSEDTVPQFTTKIYDSAWEEDIPELLLELLETPKELMERIHANTFANFICCMVDFRKIESRIPEIHVLCEYLKIIVPDEYSAYCSLADEIGFNEALDTDLYYETLNSIKKGSKW